MICDATLVFQLTTARGALPVQGAGILVTDPATGRNTYLTTDPSGRSRVLCVTAPPLAWSQSPESDGRPYSIYHADIRAAGYVPVRLTGIQVFAGQQSLQVVEMVPCEAGAGTVPPDMTIGRPRDPLEEGESRFSEAPQGDDQPPGAEGQGPVQGAGTGGGGGEGPLGPAAPPPPRAKPVGPPERRAACGPSLRSGKACGRRTIRAALHLWRGRGRGSRSSPLPSRCLPQRSRSTHRRPAAWRSGRR